MAEQIFRLAPALRFEEWDDGRCKIVQYSGHAYLFAGTQRVLFESLWRGSPVPIWPVFPAPIPMRLPRAHWTAGCSA